MADIIHIGDYKTGTSWFQKIGWPSQTLIHYIGDPVCQNLDFLLRVLVNGEDDQYYEQNIEKRLRQYFHKIKKLNNNKLLLLSREALTAECAFNGFNAKRTATRIYEAFPDAKILYFIRNQSQLFLSLYSQYLKRGGILDQKNFFLSPYQNKRIIERLKFSHQFFNYINYYKKENVLFLPYEFFKCNNYIALKYIFQKFSISAEPVIPESSKIVNPSLRLLQSYFLCYLNNYMRGVHNHKNLTYIDNIIYCLLSYKQKKIYLKRSRFHDFGSCFTDNKKHRILKQVDWYLHNKLSFFLESICFGPKLTINSIVDEQIKFKVFQDNRKLQSLINFNLDNYNYPL